MKNPKNARRFSGKIPLRSNKENSIPGHVKANDIDDHYCIYNMYMISEFLIDFFVLNNKLNKFIVKAISIFDVALWLLHYIIIYKYNEILLKYFEVFIVERKRSLSYTTLLENSK